MQIRTLIGTCRVGIYKQKLLLHTVQIEKGKEGNKDRSNQFRMLLDVGGYGTPLWIYGETVKLATNKLSAVVISFLPVLTSTSMLSKCR